MANRGNTGKRYRFRVIEQARVSERGGITFIYSCGHQSALYEPRRATDYRWTQEEADRKLGERTACFQCGAQEAR